MSEDSKKWVRIVLDAWNGLVDDIENSTYGHMREEDVRSYLFCKIRELLLKQGESCLELHADIRLPAKRADIVLGIAEEESWFVGVEIKRSGQYKPLNDDLNKLFVFMKEGKVKSGVLAAIVEHIDNWNTIFEAWELAKRFLLEPKDNGNNNYWEIRPLKEIQVENKSIMWDSLLFVLRKL